MFLPTSLYRRIPLPAFPPHRCSLVCIFSLLLTLAATSVRAETTDHPLLAGLRERRLFELAEVYCQDRLAEKDLSLQQSSAIVIELIRTFTQHALHSRPTDRAPLWQAARTSASEFLQQNENHPRRLLVSTQQALSVVAHGELLRQELEISTGGEQQLKTCKAVLRGAIELLRQLNKDIAGELRAATRKSSTSAGELSQSELISLNKNVRFQLARTYRNQAQTYPPGSTDRVSSLTQALDLLATLTDSGSLTWKVHLDQIVTLRLIRRLDQATKLIDRLEKEKPPAEAMMRLRGELARILLDRGQLDLALQTVGSFSTNQGPAPAELQLVRLATYLALWKSTSEMGRKAKADHWQNQSLAMVQAIENDHGPYWRRRAENLLSRSAAQGIGSGSLEVLRRTAENHYRRNELDEAVLAFDRAAKNAHESSLEKQAFDLSYQAALIEHQRGKYDQASGRCQKLAKSQAEHPRAPEVHLLAIVDTAELARENDSAALARYIDLLVEHPKTWPNGASADKARLWLGKIRRHQQDYGSAIKAYLEVSPQDDGVYTQAVHGLSYCYGEQLTKLIDTPQAQAALAGEAAQYFEQVITLAGENSLARFATTRSAELRLDFLSPDYRKAEQTLALSLRQDSEAPALWKASALSLLVVAQAGRRRYSSAQTTLEKISAAPTSTLLEMLRRLGAIGTQQNQSANSHQLAALQLQTTEKILAHVDPLNDAEQLKLTQTHARVLASLGKHDQASAMYRTLAAKHPQSGMVQEGYAQLLLDSQNKKSLAKARDRWREILSKSRPQSPRWYRAKYAIALAHYRLGKKKQAAQSIRLLLVLQPSLGGEAMKEKFLYLLNLCQS